MAICFHGVLEQECPTCDRATAMGRLWDRFIGHRSAKLGVPVVNLIGGGDGLRQEFIEANINGTTEFCEVNGMTIGAAPSAQQPQAAGVSERDLPPLPQSLLDAIGEYGMARTDGVGEVERLHRWELLIAGIKRYARSLLSTTSAPAQAEQPALAAAAHALTVFSAIHKAHWTHWTGHEHQDADKALGALRRAVAEQHGGAA